MSFEVLKAPRRAFTALAVMMVLAAMGAGAAAADAAVTASPDSNLSATASTTVGVTATGLDPEEDYVVGLCSKEIYGLLGIPACGDMDPVTTDINGDFSTSISVDKETANVHASIPFPLNLFQPPTFICKGTVGTEDDCQVAVATHGGMTAIVDGDDVSFLDFP